MVTKLVLLPVDHPILEPSVSQLPSHPLTMSSQISSGLLCTTGQEQFRVIHGWRVLHPRPPSPLIHADGGTPRSRLTTVSSARCTCPSPSSTPSNRFSIPVNLSSITCSFFSLASLPGCMTVVAGWAGSPVCTTIGGGITRMLGEDESEPSVT